MRIIKIAAVPFVIAMFVFVMLFGTGCKSGSEAGAGSAVARMVDDVPSTGKIIAAINARLTADDNEKLAALKKDLATAPEKCVESRAQCRNDGSIGWCFSDGYDLNCRTQVGCPLDCQETRDACVQRALKFCNDNSTEIADLKAEITNFKFQTNADVITVEKANNYEGNVISYVDLRTKGTDDIERYKVTMKLQNNTLSIVNMESSPQ